MTLRVTGLACARGGVVLLEGLSFEVSAGAALILKGPNGVGKTTLLRTLAGLQPPAAGHIAGVDERAAYASHADGVKLALSVEENLAFWADVYARPVSEDVYRQFELCDLRARPVATLSAGQRRRVGLARLAVIGRDLLFLDEPTVSLDAASVRRFADWMRGHLAAGGSAVIATHIDLGLDAPEMDLAPFVASSGAAGSDEAFL